MKNAILALVQSTYWRGQRRWNWDSIARASVLWEQLQ